jgi:hypothetical protein
MSFLEDVKEIVNEGWTQGILHWAGDYCLVGACGKALGVEDVNETPTEAYEALNKQPEAEILLSCINEKFISGERIRSVYDIPAFNDNPNTKIQHVNDILDCAISKSKI